MKGKDYKCIEKPKNIIMKKALSFIGGFVTGIVATILVAAFIGAAIQADDGFPGLTLFPEKGDCITTSGAITVFQVLAPDVALALTGEVICPVVMLTNYDNKYYYDGQKIEIPSGKCARQIGTYRYTTKDERVKTVPAVVIE